MNYKNYLFLVILSTFNAFSMQQQPAVQKPGPQLPQAATLFTAVQNNNVEAVRKLLQAIPALANSYHDDMSLLRVIVESNNPVAAQAMMQAFLDAGANPNPWDSYNITPLMGAALNGLTDVVTSLIFAGANVKAHDDGGQSALNYVDFGVAPDNVKAEIRNLLRQAGAQ